jgi:hypothetical protein
LFTAKAKKLRFLAGQRVGTVVPTGARTGKITVNTQAGKATSATDFTVV